MELEPAAWYPIGAVARKTGLSVHTLRAWERRHAVVEPRRSAGGTRLYSNADVARLRLLRRATEAGHTIGQVRGLDVEALRSLLREELAEDVSRPAMGGGGEAGWLVGEVLKAVELMDGGRTHALLMRAVVALPVRRVIDDVLIPVLREVGDRWAAGAICPANEHLLSVNVRRVLAWLTETVPVDEAAPRVIVTTPSGDWHELGAQIAGVLAAEAGWRVVFLGPNLPASDIDRAVSITGARLVLLGVTMAEENELLPELTELRDRLPGEVRVIAGGKGVEAYARTLEEIGIEFVPGFESLRQVLQGELAPAGPA